MPFKGEGAYPSVDYPDCLLRLARSHRLRFAEEYSAKAVGIQQVRIQRGGNVQQRRKVSVEHGPALRLLPPAIVLDGSHPIHIGQQTIVAESEPLHGCRRTEIKQVQHLG